MPKLILNQKVKYKGKSYSVNKKGVTVPVPVETKDVRFFENNNMIVEAIDDEGGKMYLNERDKSIEKLKVELDKLRAQLAKKDEIITDLKVQIKELKVNEVRDSEFESEVSPEDKQSPKDKQEQETESLEEKTVEELYEMAQELDIQGRTKLRNDKEELIKAIRAALAKKAGE